MKTKSATARMAGGLLLALACTSHRSTAADRDELQAWAQSVVTIEVTANDRVRRSSAVVVDDDGMLATTWQCLQGATKARVIAHDGSTADVSGYVAAQRGTDLVLLALKPNEHRWTAGRLVDRELKLHEPVHGIGGPASAPLLVASDELVRIESGQRYRMSRPAGVASVVDDDQCRLITHAYLNLTSVGGGLFADDGRLLGILIAADDWTDRIHVAIHAGHLAPLIAGRHEVRPLTQLKTLDEGGVPAADGKPSGDVFMDDSPVLVAFDCDCRERGATQRDKLRMLRERLAQLPKQQRELAEQADQWRKKAREPQLAVEALQRQAATNRVRFASMVPEIVTPSVNTAPRRLPTNQTAIAVDRRFSPRQLVERTRLNNELLAINMQLAVADAHRLQRQSGMQQAEYDQAAIGRYQSQLLRQLFYLADPLEMRLEADAEQALTELDDEIEQGGAAAIFLLVRGLTRTRLGRWDDALADLGQAAEDDRTLRVVTDLARGRVALLRGQSNGRETIQRAARSAKDDSLAQTLLARIALDDGDSSAAARWLRSAIEAGGDAIELNRALAIVLARATGAARDLRRARVCALTACELSRYSDWHSLAVLALVQAAAGAWDDSWTTLARAEDLASDFGSDVCRTWQDSLRRRELPTRNWR